MESATHPRAFRPACADLNHAGVCEFRRDGSRSQKILDQDPRHDLVDSCVTNHRIVKRTHAGRIAPPLLARFRPGGEAVTSDGPAPRPRRETFRLICTNRARSILIIQSSWASTSIKRPENRIDRLRRGKDLRDVRIQGNHNPLAIDT